MELKNIKCRICSTELKDTRGLSRHLTKHNMILNDYAKIYLEDLKKFGWQYCDNGCGKLIHKDHFNSINAFCSLKCSRHYWGLQQKGKPSPMKGKHHSEQTKQKMSKIVKDKFESGERLAYWKGKHLSEETKQKLSVINIEKYSSGNVIHPWMGRHHSDETKKKISQEHIEAFETGERIHPWINRQHTEETKQKLSEIAIERASDPNYVNPMQGKTHTEESLKKIFSKFKDTSLEQFVEKTLLEAHYSITKQFFITHDNRSFAFDFKLDDYPILIEADGDYWHGGPGVKKHFTNLNEVKETDMKKELAAQSRNMIVIRVWESEMKIDPQILLQRIKEHIS